MSSTHDPGPIARVAERLGVRAGIGRRFLALLLLLDFALIAFHASWLIVGEPSNPYFRVHNDRSYGEFIQYSKFLWGLVALWWLWRASRQAVCFGGAAVLAYFLVDDAFKVHERFGRGPLSETFPLPSGLEYLRPDIGEILWIAMVAVVLVALFWVLYRGSDPWARRVMHPFVALVLVLGVFAVGVDFVHMLHDARWYFEVMHIVEDGGEMVVVSVLVAYLFNVAAVVSGLTSAGKALEDADGAPSAGRPARSW